jgi:hypothetical protein
MYLLDQTPGAEPAFVGPLGAVVISQISALLAFVYYRARGTSVG